MKGVIELTRAKKALSQAVLLISGAIMLGFGAMRGEVETVLSKASINEASERRNRYFASPMHR